MNTVTFITRDEAFENGLFPRKPTQKPGSAFVLAGGREPPAIVSNKLAISDIRRGKFDRVVEILTNPYSMVIHMDAISKDAPFQFDVNVKVSVQVMDPLVFFAAQVKDVPSALASALHAAVRRVAKQYSIRDCNMLDEALFAALPQKEVYDGNTGMQYHVADIETTPKKPVAQKAE